MARGFESKDVEFQQAEAVRARPKGRALSPAERDAQERRRTLELALARAEADLTTARTPAYREMLAQAIAALREQIVQEPSTSG